MKFFDSGFLLFVFLSCVFAVSPWSGVAQNVVYSDLIDAGWSQCYSTTYDVATYPKSNYMTPCTQNSIMLACRKVGNPNLLVAAYSPRYTVFGQTYNGSDGLHMMNGVTWYFTEDYSIGTNFIVEDSNFQVSLLLLSRCTDINVTSMMEITNYVGTL